MTTVCSAHKGLIAGARLGICIRVASLGSLEKGS